MHATLACWNSWSLRAATALLMRTGSADATLLCVLRAPSLAARGRRHRSSAPASPAQFRCPTASPRMGNLRCAIRAVLRSVEAAALHRKMSLSTRFQSADLGFSHVATANARPGWWMLWGRPGEAEPIFVLSRRVGAGFLLTCNLMQCVVPASPAIGTERYLRHLRCSILSVMSEDAAWCPAKDKYEKELQFGVASKDTPVVAYHPQPHRPWQLRTVH